MLIYEREQFLVVDLPLFILFCDLQGLQLLIYLEQFLVTDYLASNATKGSYHCKNQLVLASRFLFNIQFGISPVEKIENGL